MFVLQLVYSRVIILVLFTPFSQSIQQHFNINFYSGIFEQTQLSKRLHTPTTFPSLSWFLSPPLCLYISLSLYYLSIYLYLSYLYLYVLSLSLFLSSANIFLFIFVLPPSLSFTSSLSLFGFQLISLSLVLCYIRSSESLFL